MIATIIDASTLISLAKINFLEILEEFKDTLVVPNEVFIESVVEGEKMDMPDATLIKNFITNNNIKIAKVKSGAIRSLSLRINKVLAKGDTAVLALALQEKTAKAITDDEGLSKIALSLGLRVKSSPDLLLDALIKGTINFREFEDYIRSLILENRLGHVVAELYIMEGKKHVEG